MVTDNDIRTARIGNNFAGNVNFPGWIYPGERFAKLSKKETRPVVNRIAVK
jgi:hypothetical protein